MNADNFSLVNGGLFYRLLKSLRLEPDEPLLLKRIALVILITWVPVLILTVVEGLAWNEGLRIPFLVDFVAHTRYLLAMPLLLIAERIVQRRVGAQVKQFVTSGLVSARERPKFDAAVSMVERLRDNVLFEVIILVVCFAVALTRPWTAAPSHVGTWRVLADGSSYDPTLAGYWYAFVSIPIFQFIFARWIWRLIIWGVFLWRVSRLDLQLVPTHADQAGGLGFLGIAPTTFGAIPFALASVVASLIGRDIVFYGAQLSQFQAQILGFVLFSVLISVGPLLMFSWRLASAKRNGMLAYGALVDLHDRAFWEKWFAKDGPASEPPMGDPDPSSLADLGVGYERIRGMRIVPFDLRAVISVALTTSVPLLPLLLTVYPFNELMQKVFEILL